MINNPRGHRNAPGSIAWVVFALALPAFAQTNTAIITGTVTDPTAAIVADARVTATNLATNVTQAAVTTGAGVYSIPALEPGKYRVTVDKEGFRRLVREPVTVTSSSTIALDLTVEVGTTSTEIVVHEDAPLVQQASSTIQYRTDLKQIDELPIANQSSLNVMTLMPGVSGDPGSEQAVMTNTPLSPGYGVTLSGSPMGTVQYQADGISNTSMYYGRISIAFSTDAVAEVSVLQNSYSAEYGRVGGGIVSMTTKSGTNQFHGTLFSFSQNDAFNASPYLNSYQKKGMLRYWRGGFDVGGPVSLPKLYNGRNRTFFFAGFEPLRQYTQGQYYIRVPTPLERQGNFSQSVYNSVSRQPVEIFQHFQTGTNKQISEPANTAYPQFPNNTIPASMISPIGQAILNLYPQPNIPLNGLGENYTMMRSVRNTDNRYSFKIDQVISGAHRISFRFSQAPTKGARVGMGGLIEWVPSTSSTGTNSALSDTYVWGGNKVNELHLGFNRSNLFTGQSDQQLAVDGFQEFGFPSRMSKGMPQITFGDTNVWNIGSDVGNHEIDNFLQLTDTLSWTKGRHYVKFGFDFQAPQQNLVDYNTVGGTWGFSPSQTNIGSGNTTTVLGIPNAQTGMGFASLLLGYPNSVSIAPAVIPYQYRWKNYAGFVQDDFKMTPNLTWNIGFRYQIEVPRSEKHDMQGYFVDEPVKVASGAQQQGYVQLDGRGGAPSTLWPTRYNGFEPRVGFAYRIPAWSKASPVWRGAYAISHVPTSGLFNSPIPDLSPKSTQIATNGATNGGQIQMDNFPAVLPVGGLNLPANGIYTDISNVNALYYLNPNVKMPYVQQWNMGFGFQFGASYGLELNYVGSKSTNLFGPSQIYNAVNVALYAQEYASGINMSQTIPNPQGIVGSNGQVIQVSRQNALRPLSTLGDITDPLEQGFDARYNALQVNFTKRFSLGFQFNANYTWSKSMDDSSGMGQYSGTAAVLRNVGASVPELYGDSHNLERSVSQWDIPNAFKLNFNWDVPLGHGKLFLRDAAGWKNQIVGNWKVSGNTVVQSGYPAQAWIGTSAGFPDTVGKIRPNVIPGVNPVVQNWQNACNNAATQVCPYINTAMFAPPSFLTLGDAPRFMDYARLPHQTMFNMALLKEFPVREQIKLVFRAEAYGALNHVYWSSNANYFTLYQNLDYQHYTTPPVASANIVPNYGTVWPGGTRTLQLGLKLYF